MNKRVLVNDSETCSDPYLQYHEKRIVVTVEKLREIGARRIVEVGGHPWAMTSALIERPEFQVCATISAEELTNWPDDLGVTRRSCRIKTPNGKEVWIVNYQANIERSRFDIQERPDTVLACEIVEHLIRSPHVMFLNINRWLPIGGKVVLTTPNGAQFSNPFRRRSPTPAYRSNIYERHSYLYTMSELIDLVTLCGFKISENKYLDVYERNGLSKIYGILSHIPLGYFEEKFKKMIWVVAQKEKDVSELDRCPRVYDPRGNWEFIKREASS